MFPKPRTPEPDTLPPWAEGQITLFAFRALKQAKAPYGFTGKPATMRKLEARGLVQQTKSGAYVMTENGRSLVEGSVLCPPDIQRRWEEMNRARVREDCVWQPAHSPRLREPAFPERFGPNARKGAAEEARAGTVRDRAYSVQPVTGGCEVIRLAPRSKIRLRVV